MSAEGVAEAAITSSACPEPSASIASESVPIDEPQTESVSSVIEDPSVVETSQQPESPVSSSSSAECELCPSESKSSNHRESINQAPLSSALSPESEPAPEAVVSTTEETSTELESPSESSVASELETVSIVDSPDSMRCHAESKSAPVSPSIQPSPSGPDPSTLIALQRRLSPPSTQLPQPSAAALALERDRARSEIMDEPLDRPVISRPSSFSVDSSRRLISNIPALIESNSRNERTSQRVSVCHDRQKIKLEDCDFMKKLGQGSTGYVMLVRHRPDRRFFALKVTHRADIRADRAKALEERINEDIRSDNELTVYRAMLPHPYVMSLLYWTREPQRNLMFLELCRGGSLQEIADRRQFNEKKALRRPLSERVVKFYAIQLVAALDHLHRAGIFFRDLKLDNILLDERGFLRLTDFDVSLKMTCRRPRVSPHIHVCLGSLTFSCVADESSHWCRWIQSS